jgi:hypothetical protein
MMDGTPIEQNSLQRVDYVDRPGWRGRSNFTDEQLREILQLALTRSTQLALHVVGDAETVDIAPLYPTKLGANSLRVSSLFVVAGPTTPIVG